MRRRRRSVPLLLRFLLLMIVLLPGGASAQGQDETGTRTINDILSAWGNPQFWVFLVVVALFGALGGLVYELMTLRGRFEVPHRTDDIATGEDLEGAIAKYLYDLGLLGRMIIGALAAIVVVWPLGLIERGPLAVLSGSILAGAAGIAVFRSLQDRLLAAIATRELVKTQAQAAEQTQAVEEAAVELEQLKGRLQAEASFQATGLEMRTQSRSISMSLPDLDRLSQKLGVARAFGMAAASGTRVSVRMRVYRVLSAWSGNPVERIPPDTKKIILLWQENENNPQISDGILSDLIVRLRADFPQAGIALVPADLTREGGVDTIRSLVAHIEIRMLSRA